MSNVELQHIATIDGRALYSPRCTACGALGVSVGSMSFDRSGRSVVKDVTCAGCGKPRETQEGPSGGGSGAGIEITDCKNINFGDVRLR